MTLDQYEKIKNENVYDVFDENGNKINSVVASESFVKEHFASYQFVRSLLSPEMERCWRDEKLKETDSLMVLSDYPHRVKLEEYRQLLRDWPSTESFPETRPVLFDEFLNQIEINETI